MSFREVERHPRPRRQSAVSTVWEGQQYTDATGKLSAAIESVSGKSPEPGGWGREATTVGRGMDGSWDVQDKGSRWSAGIE